MSGGGTSTAGGTASSDRWASLTDEVVELLRSLIRFDTTNPPGNETACLRWVSEQLRGDGIACDIVEPAPGRGNLVARLSAGVPDPESPLLLPAHVDVVAAPDPGAWTYPPFEGRLVDGWVWGRGALDMKGPAASTITVFRALRRWGLRLRRDVVLMLNADEEAGGTWGAKWMAEHHPLVRGCGAALNEGGGMAITVGDERFFMVAVDEKRSYRFTMTAVGRSGHAAIPHDDNAIVHLGRAVAAVGRARAPARITPTFADCIRTIAERQPPTMRDGLLQALDPRRVDEVLDELVPFPLRERLRAMVRTTYVPTMLSAGEKDNVLPDTATATINCRALPDDDPETIRLYLNGVLREAGVADKIRFGFGEFPVFPAAPLRHPLLDSLTRAMAHHAPGQPLVPVVGIAGSDNRHLRPHGIAAYGFYPMPPEVDVRLFHNVDERVSVAQLALATRVIGDTVLDYCVVP